MNRLSPFGAALLTSQLPSMPELLSLLDEHKLVLVRGLSPMEREEFLEFCRSADPGNDPCLHWDFGPVMDMKPQREAKNYLFSREAVPFHWDGAFHRVPSVLVFNCVAEPTPGAGGQTLFCDTEKLFSAIPDPLRSRLSTVKLTYCTEKVAHYGGRVTVPLVDRHPRKGTERLRFAEPVSTLLNPVSLEVEGMEAFDGDRLVRYLSSRAYDEDVCYEHEWREGDLLLADNHSLIHGRRPFCADTERHLRRIQLV